MMNSISANESSLSTAAPEAVPVTIAEESQQPFRWGQVLRLSTFHIGSAMVDILVSSVWNRVMIADFHISPSAIGLLLALRYLLAPVGIWAGYRSDTRPFMGWQRTPYIWFGRLLVVLALPLLGFSTGRLTVDSSDLVGWLLAVLCFLFYGLGTLISGGVFLALVRESVPPEKQGLAISLAQTVLIICFPIAAAFFSRWMAHYDEATFWQMIVVTMLVGAFFWFFATVGVEDKRRRKLAAPAASGQLSQFFATFQKIWQDQRTRRFFVFFSLATVAAWTHDTILEPFGAQVFQLNVEQTTDFSRYWLGMTVLTLLISLAIWRKRRPEQQTSISKAGLGVMAFGMFLLAISAFGGQLSLVRPALLLFGGGFGVYTFGGLSLLAAMTSAREAGTYLGLWTLVEFVFKGLGTLVGGVLLDGLLPLTGSAGMSYGLIFALAAICLTTAAIILSTPQVLSFAREHGRPLNEPVILEVGD